MPGLAPPPPPKFLGQPHTAQLPACLGTFAKLPEHPEQPAPTLTDSTTPNRSPSATEEPSSGSSTYTRSPSSSYRQQYARPRVKRMQGLDKRRWRQASGWRRAAGGTHLCKVGDAHRHGVAVHLDPLVILGILQAIDHCGAGRAGSVAGGEQMGNLSPPYPGRSGARWGAPHVPSHTPTHLRRNPAPPGRAGGR